MLLYWKYRSSASMFHARIFHRRFESGRNTMKENTVALKFYNIAIDASLIDHRRNKKNIFSKNGGWNFIFVTRFYYDLYFLDINNDNRNVTLFFTSFFCKYENIWKYTFYYYLIKLRILSFQRGDESVSM